MLRFFFACYLRLACLYSSILILRTISDLQNQKPLFKTNKTKVNIQPETFQLENFIKTFLLTVYF